MTECLLIGGLWSQGQSEGLWEDGFEAGQFTGQTAWVQIPTLPLKVCTLLMLLKCPVLQFTLHCMRFQ
jgi:hypothetical protein